MTTRLAPQASPTLQGYDHHVDGLFTYCLSVLCEHDAAIAAVREVRDLVQRHSARLAGPELLRAWLYSLARHCCLRRLGQGAGGAAGATPDAEQAAERRRELASLAWPEAAGTAPEQREALELAVRHRLRPDEIAAVLGLSGAETEALLSAAGAEVGRTRAALLVLGVGSCPVLAQLGGVGAESWRDWVLGPALRRELVQHVVDCPTCRGTAERVADGPGLPGEGGTGRAGLANLSGLPMLPAPLAVRIGATPDRSAHDTAGAAFLSGAAAGRRALRTDDATALLDLRFDQRGFPRHRASGPGRGLAARGLAVRQRVVTTGVLAAVLTAPVVALWAAHRGGDPAEAVSSVRVDAASPTRDGAASSSASGRPASGGLQLAGAAGAETLLPMVEGVAVSVPSRGRPPAFDNLPVLSQPADPNPGAAPADPGAAPVPVPVPAPAAGQLTVEANDYAGRTILTLTNSGGTTIQWHAVLDAAWLRLSRDSGSLEPGQRITVTVTVDESRAPQTHWTARIALPPSEAVVTLEGGPQQPTGRPTSPSPSGPPPSTGPSQPPSSPPSQLPSSPPSPSPSVPASAPPSASASAPSTHSTP
ncbi:sigma-70 family RNA polymerase sigma factor [Kitasatospora sp. MAP5-34]|uniref:BACON domain-containing protein n=1 Tax=Kitasatospora sp. MAP5-34 TaxID=3035102 RepID=UPI0024750DE3|nr:sigma-70 family RNA polymerase sigma factor [Kitasatospora sp. MAP5-34]